ncbi:MAG: thioredoxin 1 [Tenuifilum sp.]|jgi:thioredoxin-like negative regulator of GroEL|uniref:Thioredoxin family protein n=1 Tax=Tenuifilum thalassicum TaxID=2590900 RepID=A0A7D3XUZ2_9BACT|nr:MULTISPECIES: thioredoxin family protein [Tenuifilum]MDI3526737.1 thioredoxin 1 [Tenuifilum sp.]QKG79488.1 thioredoxin family protein [Tenuifilum thalassicum]
MVKVIQTETDLSSALSEPATAIYFNSDACGVCHVMLPQLEQIVGTEFPKMNIYVVNANETPEICGKFSVFTFPTVLIFFEGKESLRMARNINLATFKQAVARPYSILFD